MSFADAVSRGLSQYAVFTGRARRSEYWYFALFQFLVMLAAILVDRVIGTYPLFYAITALALFLPGLGLSVRRLHDTGRSGWLYLIVVIPLVGVILLLVWFCQDSAPDNQYGPNPKGVSGGMGAPSAYR